MLPLPFLNAMARSAKAVTATQPPLRFVALFKPNGVHPPSWNIEGASEHDFQCSPMMAPFAQHRADLIIVDNMGASGFSSHQAAAQRFLSGRLSNDERGFASIDQLIADKIGAATAHRSLELTTEGLFTPNPECSYVSYNSQGRPVPRESDPQLVFDRLFRDPLVHPEKRRDMISLLDRVGDHARSLARRVGREDRETLDQYLSVVRETEKRIEELEGSSAAARNLDAFARPATARNLDEQVEIMMDLIALALWTDSTRCVSYMLGNDNSRMIFDFLGVMKEHHYLSHYFRNFSRANLQDLYKVCLWHMEKFDYLLTRMKSYHDGEGRLLDHSLVLFGAGMGESDNHTAQRIPTVLAGSAGGRFETGRYVRHASFLELGHLHRALLDVFGVEPPPGHVTQRCSALAGLDGSRFPAYHEQPFESWVDARGGQVKVQGRLRFSSDLSRANQFFVDVAGRSQPVRVQVSFKALQQHNLLYFCGTPVLITGSGTQEGEETIITQITELQSLIGVAPGKERL